MFFTVKVWNFEDYAQTWPVELVDNTGNVWWPNGTSEISANYSLYSDGSIKIYAHKVARITVTGIKVYQNTTFYLKVAGFPTASAHVKVKGGSPIVVEDSFCENPYFDFKEMSYRATLVCKAEFRNLESVLVKVNDVTVKTYVLTNVLNDTASGSWSVIPSDFTIDPRSTKEVEFELPLVISTWVPVSVADATKLALKSGEITAL